VLSADSFVQEQPDYSPQSFYSSGLAVMAQESETSSSHYGQSGPIVDASHEDIKSVSDVMRDVSSNTNALQVCLRDIAQKREEQSIAGRLSRKTKSVERSVVSAMSFLTLRTEIVIESLREKIDELEKERNSLRSENTGLQQQRDMLQKRQEELHLELEQLADENRRLRTSIGSSPSSEGGQPSPSGKNTLI
jgi:chromosome segregation ATPase